MGRPVPSCRLEARERAGELSLVGWGAGGSVASRACVAAPRRAHLTCLSAWDARKVPPTPRCAQSRAGKLEAGPGSGPRKGAWRSRQGKETAGRDGGAMALGAGGGGSTAWGGRPHCGAGLGWPIFFYAPSILFERPYFTRCSFPVAKTHSNSVTSTHAPSRGVLQPARWRQARRASRQQAPSTHLVIHYDEALHRRKHSQCVI